MDGDLWNWTYDQGFSFSDAGESCNHVDSGWQADFGKDVIEEDAMNEKYCVQVLKILIRKAADEIDDLEEDLVLLQCDLAWTESRDQYEACCNALREKIDVLHNSIQILRQSDEIYTADLLPLHRQPAEKLYDILKPFVGESREQDDVQDQHATGDSQSTNTSMQLVGPSCDTSRISDMKVEIEEMEVKSNFLAMDSIPVQMHPENDSIADKKVKPEIAVGVSSNVPVTEENGCLESDDLKSVSEVKSEESKELCINNSCKSKKMKSASNIVGESGPEALKHEKSVFAKANPDAPRQLDGFSGNKRPFDTNSSSPAYSKSGSCNIEEKLIDFLLRKKKNKSEVGSILPESKVDHDQRVSVTQKPATFDKSNFHMMLLLKLQEQQANHLVRTHTKKADKLLQDDSQNVENVCLEKSHLNVGHKLKAFTEKGQSKSNTLISKAKKHRKPGAIGDNACLDLPHEQKPQVKSVEMQDGDLDTVKNIGPSSHYKGTSEILAGRDFIDLSFVDDISSSDQIKPDSITREDKQIVKDNHIDEVLRLFSSSDLKLMNLTQLRILAKEHNLTKYHKLRKGVLLDMLVRKVLE